MLFNSFSYLIFLPLVLVAYYLIPKRYRWIMLVLVSYYFYMCWKPVFALFMFISTTVDYWAGLGMHNSTTKAAKKRYMFASLFINLGMLFFFKYLNFVTYNVEVLMAQFNIFYDSPILDIILPVGISFYTFQSLSYTIDVYKGKEVPEKHFGYFMLYVSYFPQLVAGPINRPGYLIPQLRDTPPLESEDVRYAINKILLGYFKKVVVADNLALYVDQMFAHVPGGTGLQYCLAAVMFIIQLYADFSGYTDIAMGSARLLGVKLQDNFNRPFFTTSLSRFWSRWHISLTSWIGDYVFKPLLFKYRKWAWAVTIFVFLLIGIWHGAAWTFVVFGFLNGVVMVIQNLYQGIKPLHRFNRSRLGKVFLATWNFCLLALLGIFFRSATVADSWAIFRHIFTDTRFHFRELRSAFMAEMYLGIFVIALLACTVLFDRKLRFRWNWAYVVIMLLVIMVLGSDSSNQFIYFQF